MSSDRDLVSKKGRFTLERTPRRFRSSHPYLWRQETPKRSSSRSRTPATKRIKKMKKPIRVRTSRNYKTTRRDFPLPRENQVVRQPECPHNTTQYIIGVNDHPTESPNVYQATDRFEFDFQHHAMAGSMMSLMKERFSFMQDQFATPTTTCGDFSVERQEDQMEELQEDYVCDSQAPKIVENKTCFDMMDEDETENSIYSHYLKQAESKEDLKGLVKHLVNVLEQKDQEILELKEKVQYQFADVAKR